MNVKYYAKTAGGKFLLYLGKYKEIEMYRQVRKWPKICSVFG